MAHTTKIHCTIHDAAHKFANALFAPSAQVIIVSIRLIVTRTRRTPLSLSHTARGSPQNQFLFMLLIYILIQLGLPLLTCATRRLRQLRAPTISTYKDKNEATCACGVSATRKYLQPYANIDIYILNIYIENNNTVRSTLYPHEPHLRALTNIYLCGSLARLLCVFQSALQQRSSHNKSQSYYHKRHTNQPQPYSPHLPPRPAHPTRRPNQELTTIIGSSRSRKFAQSNEKHAISRLN